MTLSMETSSNRYVDLSIVIIARNEAMNIARAIESVLHAIENWPNTEILLVDSASTDETVEIAKRYPINIVRLPSSWFLSVGAGRLIGMHYTRGEFVLHMDGDAELEPDWVDRAMTYALGHPEVAAVGAYYRNIYVKDGQIVGEEDQIRDPHSRILEVKHAGGASLYRRSAIQQMGGFQPFIRGEEGIYLCMGLRHAGYKLMQLPTLGWKHYCIPPQSTAGYLRRQRLGFITGNGQVLRYYWGTDLFWKYLKERCIYTVIYLIGVLISLFSLFLIFFSRKIIFLESLLLCLAVVILVFAIKKHSLRKALSSLLVQTWVAYSTLLGFMKKPRSPEDYPLDAEIVQVCFHRGGLRAFESTSTSKA